MFSTFFFATIFAVVLSKELPSYFPRCRVNDENLEKCVIAAANTLRPYLRTGIEELGIPAFDPLTIPELTFSQGNDAVNIKITLRNIKLHGFDMFEFERANLDPKTFKFEGLLNFNNLTLDSEYEMEGKVLTLPILGKGKTKGFLDKATGKIVYTVDVVTRKGEKYFALSSVKINVKIGTADIVFDGLINENEELAKATNQVIKENTNDVLKEILPAIETVCEGIVSKMLKGLSKNIPINKLMIVDE